MRGGIEGWDPREPRANEQRPYESTRKQLFECLVWICAPALLYEVVRFQVPSSKTGDGQCESRDPGAATADCGLLSAADGAACVMQAAQQGMLIKRVWVSSTTEERHCTYLVDRELYYDGVALGWLAFSSRTPTRTGKVPLLQHNLQFTSAEVRNRHA